MAIENGFKPFLRKDSRTPPQAGFRSAQLASACLREAASAEAGAFLSSLRKMTFSANGPEQLAQP
jgi:hypothetical protein